MTHNAETVELPRKKLVYGYAKTLYQTQWLFWNLHPTLKSFSFMLETVEIDRERIFFFFSFFNRTTQTHESVIAKWLKGVRENVLWSKERETTEGEALNERDTMRCGKCCGVLMYTLKEKTKQNKKQKNTLNVYQCSLSLSLSSCLCGVPVWLMKCAAAEHTCGY